MKEATFYTGAHIQEIFNNLIRSPGILITTDDANENFWNGVRGSENINETIHRMRRRMREMGIGGTIVTIHGHGVAYYARVLRSGEPIAPDGFWPASISSDDNKRLRDVLNLHKVIRFAIVGESPIRAVSFLNRQEQALATMLMQAYCDNEVLPHSSVLDAFGPFYSGADVVRCWLRDKIRYATDGHWTIEAKKVLHDHTGYSFLVRR